MRKEMIDTLSPLMIIGEYSTRDGVLYAKLQGGAIVRYCPGNRTPYPTRTGWALADSGSIRHDLRCGCFSRPFIVKGTFGEQIAKEAARSA